MSRASQQVGFAIAPAGDTATLEHLDFVPLDGGKILVVVVVDRRARLAQGDRAGRGIRPDELQQAANYLNSEFKGRSLLEVRQAVLSGCARSAASTTS